MKAFLDKLPGVLAGAGVLTLLSAAGAYLVLGELNRWVLTAAAIGLVLIVYAILERPALLRQIASGRGARYGSNSLIMVAAFIGILVLVNMLAARHYYRADLTSGKDFSLSEQSVKIAQALSEPVRVLAFYQSDQPGREELTDLLKEYGRYTDKLEIEFVDPVARPGVAREHKVESYGTTVFVAGERRQAISSASEAEVTSALLKLTRGEAKKVYFVTGHGELDIDGFDRNGANELKRLLELENYRVEPLALASARTVPSDAAVIVLAGAREKLLPDETTALSTFLEGGGKLLVLAEPRSPGNPVSLLADWGVELGDGVLIDAALNLNGDPLTPAIVRYPPNSVMKNVGAEARLLTVFPAATSVTKRAEIDATLRVTTIAETSERSWLETDARIVQFEPDKDKRGPLVLAVTVTKQPAEGPPGGRLVVIGNANFMTNAYLMGSPIPGNRDLALNSISWLAEDETLLGVRSKSPTDRSLFLTGVQQNLLVFTTTLFVPLIVLAIGGFVWWSRR